MRQGTGYAYGDGEDYISYKCEGCGQRVRVTPTQAKHFRGTFTACSRVCVLKARDLRTQQCFTRPPQENGRCRIRVGDSATTVDEQYPFTNRRNHMGL